MPLSVLTPAPPKNTMRLLSAIQLRSCSIFVFICDLPQNFFVLLAVEPQGGIQVGTALPRAEDGLLPAPACDLGVVAGEQDIRHAQAVPLGGAAVLGILQCARPVAFILKAGSVGQRQIRRAGVGQRISPPVTTKSPMESSSSTHSSMKRWSMPS